MKIRVFISLFMISLATQAQERCGVGPILNLDYVLMGGTECAPEKFEGKKKDKKICECLQNAAAKNVFINSRLNQNDQNLEFQQKIQTAKVQYAERFDSVYRQMTLDASIQAEVLGLNEKQKKMNSEDKITGCSAKEFSQKMNEKLSQNKLIQLDELQKLKKSIEGKKKLCHSLKGKAKEDEKCHHLQEMLTQIDKNREELSLKTTCELALSLFFDKLSHNEEFKSDLLKIKSDYFQANRDLEAVTFLKITAPLRNLQTSCEMTYEKLKELENTISAGAEVIKKRDHQCEKGDYLCEQFENKNHQFAGQAKQSYEEKPSECITRAEFDSFKAMPGVDFMRALKDKHPEKLLELPKKNATPLDIQRIEFLRSNPIIAKMATDPNKRKVLGEKLQNLANKLDAQASTGDRFKSYLHFMRTDVKEILENEQMRSTDAFVCEILANNYAAIQIANDIPPLDEVGKKENELDKFFNEIDKCHAAKLNKSSSTDLASTLKISPLFHLGLDQSQSTQRDQEFSDLKNSLCDGYEGFSKKHCQSIPVKDCRATFLTQQKQNSPMSEVASVAMKDSEYKSNLNVEEIEKIRNYTDETKQNHEYRKWYQENISSRLSKNAIASRNHVKEFRSQKYQDAKFSSSLKAPGNLNDPTSPGRRVTSSELKRSYQGEDKRDLGQDIPPYAINKPRIDPDLLPKAIGTQDPTDLIPGFNQLTPSEQIQSLNEVKDFIKKNENAPFKEDQVDKKIQKIQKKISQAPSESSSSAKGQASVNPLPSLSLPQKASVINPSPQGGQKTSTQPISPSKKPINQKISEEVNQALNQANESRENEQKVSRSLASVHELLVNFKAGTVDPKDMDPSLLSSEEELTPKTHMQYLDIKTDLSALEKFLEENLDTSRLSKDENKVLRINDPRKSPNAFILLQIKLTDEGLSVQVIDRKSTLRDLNNTLAP